jgi:polyisoprenoid-binding protein YceI
MGKKLLRWVSRQRACASDINFWQYELIHPMMKFSYKRMARLLSITTLALVAPVVLSALPEHATPQTGGGELVLAIDPATSKVHWTLDSSLHTVHGTFALKRGTLRVELASGKAGGEIVADATSGNSGNDGRDKKMHKEILESGRYAEVIFRPDRVEGKITPQGICSVQIHGAFVLHGGEHELTIPVQAELGTDHWSGTAKFDIPYIEWGLKNPSNFLLKANHVVNVELELKGSLQRPSAP